MLVTLIIVSWVLSMLPATDYIRNGGKVFNIHTDKELLEATLYMLIPIVNILVLAGVLGKYFERSSK